MGHPQATRQALDMKGVGFNHDPGMLPGNFGAFRAGSAALAATSARALPPKSGSLMPRDRLRVRASDVWAFGCHPITEIDSRLGLWARGAHPLPTEPSVQTMVPKRISRGNWEGSESAGAWHRAVLQETHGEHPPLRHTAQQDSHIWSQNSRGASESSEKKTLINQIPLLRPPSIRSVFPVCSIGGESAIVAVNSVAHSLHLACKTTTLPNTPPSKAAASWLAPVGRREAQSLACQVVAR